MSNHKLVWLLWRQNEESDILHLLGVYETKELLMERVEKIRKANQKYELVNLETSKDGMYWRIGPEEDQGFFGDKPVLVYARTVNYFS